MSALTLLVVAALNATSGVSGVVVYPDRAQVIRSATAECTGVTRLKFERIPPAADPQTVRAKAIHGTVEGVQLDERPTTTAYGPQQEAQRQKVRAMERDLVQLEHERDRAQDALELAAQFSQVATSEVNKELAEPKPNTRAWALALDTSLDARLRASVQLAELQPRLQKAYERLNEERQKLQTLDAASQRAERSAEVLVRCANGRAEVELNYLVGGASWSPAYEARADEAGGVVELATYATVRQATGEDWSKAAVVLSTAVPSEDATVPELRTLRVLAHERKQEKKVLVRRDEVRERAEAASAGDTSGAGLQARAQGLSVQLVVPGESNVPGDGTDVRLLVGKTRLKATFVYRAVPKLLPVVFRIADVVNSAPFPLLPGSVDTFRRSGFIGRFPLERVAQGAPFQLTFGPEEELRLERTIKEELRKQEGLFGSKRRFTYAYGFELSNFKNRKETVELMEHIPVSELDDVTVEIQKDRTTAGYSLTKEEGIATWKVSLSPGEKKVVDLAFQVDVPSSYESGGL